MTRPHLSIVPKPGEDATAGEGPSLPIEGNLPLQAEMPFAMVQGEPLTQLPRDLYIPPQALEVFLEAFEGPLDLLLYLIRRQNLDILDIPLADITRQYMDYIGMMNELQLELAGEYLVMAATLAEIKSRMLLPRSAEATTDEADPRAELVRRLQEYERYKQAAESIDHLPRLERDTWVASAPSDVYRPASSLPKVSLQEMIVAFREVVARAQMFAHHHVQRERLSVRARMTDILATVEGDGFAEFTRLFRAEEGRMGVTVTFMAILELVREGLLDLVQTEVYGPLHVRRANRPPVRAVPDLPAEAAAAAVAAGTVEDDTIAPLPDGLDDDDLDDDLDHEDEGIA